jgi:hypothetical protein
MNSPCAIFLRWREAGFQDLPVRVLIQIWLESTEWAFQFVEVGAALLEIRDMRLFQPAALGFGASPLAIPGRRVLVFSIISL